MRTASWVRLSPSRGSRGSGQVSRWRAYGLGVLGSAVVLGAAAGSGRVFWLVLLMGVVSPPLWAGWWRLAPVVADRTGSVADWCAYVHARHSWPVLAEQLGLALVDPRSARRIIPAGGGTVAGSGALVLDPGETRYIVPRLRFRRTGHGWSAEGRLPGGVLPEHFSERVPFLLHAWRAFLLTVDSPRRGWVRLVVFRSDPLTTPIPALPVPAPDAVDLTALVLGRREDGAPWVLRLAGRHVLVAGSTGAGKGSVVWSLLRAVCPLVAAGVVQVWTADPKRMEFPAGRALFTRYECDPEAMVVLFEDAARVMAERAGRLAGVTRQHVPSPAEPLILLNVDELAFLTAYQLDRKLRERLNAVLPLLLTQGRAVGVAVVAAVQDPRKEVVNFRSLFPVRVALRLDEPSQVDLVLGDGALDRGAACHLIPADEDTGAGIGYVVVEGDPYPRRVRAGYPTDDDIVAMAADYPAPIGVPVASAGPAALPPVT